MIEARIKGPGINQKRQNIDAVWGKDVIQDVELLVGFFRDMLREVIGPNKIRPNVLSCHVARVLN